MQSGACAALVLRRKVGGAPPPRLGDVATSSEWSRISVTNGKGLVFPHSSRCTPDLILARPSARRGAQPHFSSPPLLISALPGIGDISPWMGTAPV